ncbi:hypothetical protein ACQT3V_13090 [Brucella sp. NF 2653]|uniref:hypothetical protein n=1 Tax=Brucella sp. NF 2653 TaxID=693748 RepID=UPI003D0D1C55
MNLGSNQYRPALLRLKGEFSGPELPVLLHFLFLDAKFAHFQLQFSLLNLQLGLGLLEI